MKAHPTPQRSQIEHEQALVRAFIIPAKRARIGELLANPRRRETILKTLDHFRDFDSRCVRQIPAAKQSASGIATILRNLRAPDLCYVISTRPDLDSHELPLMDVLNEIHGMGDGTIISCIPGKLGYFEGEDPSDRFILLPANSGVASF